jgi:hypothetical protein
MENETGQLKMRVEEQTLTEVPDGLYETIVSGWEETKLEFGPCLRFKFKITAGPEAGKTVSGLAAQTLNPATKLYAWVKAISGVAPGVGSDVDFQGLIGKPIRVLVKNKNKVGNTGETLRYPNVKEIVPA